MNQTTLPQAPTVSLPLDAEQVRVLPNGQTFYVLPKNDKRLFPIHVFVGVDAHRESADRWFEAVAEVYIQCTDPAAYVLHDMRHPRVHFTAYVTAKAREITKLRPDVGGATAVLFKPGQAFFTSLLMSILQNLPVTRSTHFFQDYDKAMEWLLSQMQLPGASQ